MRKYMLFFLLEICSGFCHNSRRFQGHPKLKTIFPIRPRRFSMEERLKTKLERRVCGFCGVAYILLPIQSKACLKRNVDVREFYGIHSIGKNCEHVKRTNSPLDVLPISFSIEKYVVVIVSRLFFPLATTSDYH